MKQQRPHIKLNTKAQKEQSIPVKFNYGFPVEDKKEVLKAPNYASMVKSFRYSLKRYKTDIQIRINQRNEALKISTHIDYIQILFQDQFTVQTKQKNYYQDWYNDFGLLGVNFSKFNHEILFAVVDQDRFNSFLKSIENFILKESNEKPNVYYAGKVKFIKEFKLLTTSDIIKLKETCQLTNLRLIDFPLDRHAADDILTKLKNYFFENGLKHRLSETSNNLEIFNASIFQIEEITKNFDIVLSVTSSLSTVIGPSLLNTVERKYGFEISNPDEELPIIGILDTGISKSTPLASIIINDDSFNLTKTSPFIDNANAGDGHGTSVAALAAFGRKPYATDYRGAISADAKLLSIKIMDANTGYLSENEILTLLNRAKAKYPDIKLFVLTTCYRDHKLLNEDYSTYAFELDKFAHQNDILIFICTANNNDSANHHGYDLSYFFNEFTNLCSPSESMNNVIVGAAADNLRNEQMQGISFGKEFPALYTRKSHIDLSDLFPTKKQNKNLFRPDVIECGGDYEQSGMFIGTGERASMELLSANPAMSFYKHSGTSYSTPLVANIAAQIQKKYPLLKAQTIKALIVNGASLELIKFNAPLVKLLNKTAGHGFVNPIASNTSTDNSITFIIEDEIQPEEMIVIPIHFPEYLTTDNLDKSQGLLKIKATLCFSFDPVLNNQLGYCPLNMSFAIFRNHSAEEIQIKEDEKNGGIKSRLRQSWSQNSRDVSKPIPSANTQKVQFQIGVKELKDENSTFKLAVICRINPQLLPGIEEKYKVSHPFSMAITIEENLPDQKLTDKLYSEMIAINHVENITHIVADTEVDIDLEG